MLEDQGLPADLLFAADRDNNGRVNFSEYLLIRRAVVAWLQCSQSFMNRAGLRCGLALTSQHRTISQSEADIIFKLGNNLMKSD